MKSKDRSQIFRKQKSGNQKIDSLFYLVYSVFCILFSIFCVLSFEAIAEEAHDEYKRIQRDIRKHKKKLETVKKEEQSVVEDLKRTTSELNEIERQLKTQREKIKKIQSSISVLQSEINKNKEGISSQANLLKTRLKALQRISKENDNALILLSGEDFWQTIRMLRYMNDISLYDRRIINKYEEIVVGLDRKQKELQRVSDELKIEDQKLTRLEDSLKEKKKEREILLTNVRKEKKAYENMIKELQEASNRLLRIIQESEKREKETAKKRETTQKPGTKEEYIPEDSSFAKLKGRLPWPANGPVAIQYGTQVDPIFNLPVFRSGIHIKTNNGDTVRAVHEGKIVFADDFKGYNKLVIISHGGGYHTLYGNLVRIFPSNGAIIKKGDSIGEVGESATLGTSGLYFEVRYRGKPLDPQQWLRR